MSVDRGDLLSAWAARRVTERRMPAAAWWVETPERPTRSGARGHATLVPEPVPAGVETPFDLASLTKALATAPLLVLLEQDGVLSIDDGAGRFLPELGASPWRAATLHELAAHVAGLPAWLPLYLEGAGLRCYLRQIAAARSEGAGRTLYSDLGYILLGAAIERAAGKPLDRLFAERIAEPLGLSRCGFARAGRGFADAAATESGNDYERSLTGEAGGSHPWRTGPLRGEVHDANAHGLDGVAGHAGLFGTVAEVAAICRELLEPRRIGLGPTARTRLLERAGPERRRTIGFTTAAESRAARGILPDGAPGHTGFTGTSAWLDPAARRFFVLLTNRVHPRVEPRDFQPVRRAFHRLALRIA